MDVRLVFYPPAARWRLTGVEALCTEGDCAAYLRRQQGTLLVREGFFLFSLPSQEAGQLVRLSPEELGRLKPHFSPVLLANYSLLDGSLLLWEDLRSLGEKLRLASAYGYTEALVPEGFRGGLSGRRSPPGWSPSRCRGG